jgi:type I restriction enzyme S subunit
MSSVAPPHQVDWMGGGIPKNWTIFKLKHILSEEKKEIGCPAPAGAISFGEVVYKDFDNAETLATYRSVRPGQFLINPLNLNYDLKSLRIALSEIEVRVSPAYIVATNNKKYSNANYLRWALRVFDVQHMKTLGAGVRQTVTFEDIGNSPIALPCLEEQSKIASYLGRATTRIDALVAKKTRFIQLLREKRQALITHAVNKGLNDGAPMKDSGVEWLGEVPATWDVAPLRVFLTLRRDVVGTASATTKLLSLTLQGVIERDLENPTGKMPASFDSYQRVSTGDMVFCLFDMDETPRTVGIAPEEGMITGAYTVFRPSSDLWASFLYYFFLHVDEYKRLKPFYKGLRKTIRPGPFLSIQVPRPPVEVAEEIVAYLNRATSRIDVLLAKTERSIELLREHRAALITAAVTGKIDLREAV